MKARILIAVAAGLALMANSASALQLFPTGDGNYPGNNGENTIVNWLNDQIDFFNLANNPDLPAAVLPSVPQIWANVTGGVSIDTTGYMYLVLHWGNANDHSAQNDQAFYLPAYGVFPAEDSFFADPGRTGLSFARLYNEIPQTPDAASTLGLLGMAMLGLSGLTRFFRK